MNTDQTMNFAYLALLGAAVAGSYIVANRNEMGKMAQQAVIWALIFVGVIGAIGMWGQISQTVNPRQAFASENEVIVPRQSDGHYYLTLDLNSVPVDFVIDTGASQIVLTQDDPVLMMHTLNEVLLEQNEKAHAELLSNYQAVLEESFNQWREYSTKRSNIINNASMNKTQLTKDQFAEQCIQLIDEKIKNGAGQSVRELARISRQAAIINLLASLIVLLSIVIVFFVMI